LRKKCPFPGIPLHRPEKYINVCAHTTRILQIAQNPDSFTNALILRRRITHPADSKSQPSWRPTFPIAEDRLDHEALDLVLEGADLAHEVGGLVGGDAAADDSAADTAGTAESHLAGDVNLKEGC